MVQKGLKEPMKWFGIVTAFNNMDVTQTRNFIKISCQTYISKILKGHGWENIQHSTTIQLQYALIQNMFRNWR